MHHSGRARVAGALGIIGGALWLISVVMQHSLGLFTPDESVLRATHQLLALTGIIGAMVGFLGLLWGRCFHGRLGPISIIVYIIGYALIVIGGFALLITGPVESPLFLIFPELLLGGAWLAVGLAVFTDYQRDPALRAT